MYTEKSKNGEQKYTELTAEAKQQYLNQMVFSMVQEFERTSSREKYFLDALGLLFQMPTPWCSWLPLPQLWF